jgi:DNA excision repair protein ERCC-8
MNESKSSLGRCLGTVSTPTFRRRHNAGLVDRLAHDKHVAFSSNRQDTDVAVAHQAGVNCLAIDNNQGRYLFSGGADSSIRMWDLEADDGEPTTTPYYRPSATLTRGSVAAAHTHALTSISLYPFDPVPSTLLTTSYDKTLKVTAVTPTAMVPVHTFDLDFLPYTHGLSARPDASPLIAVGTAHPAVRLLDLRSGLSTHSLSGPNGAVYTVCWSPHTSHVLASGSTDGRVLFFDIRRAHAAFASLDLDDAVGVVGDQPSTGLGARAELLDFGAVAHNGPVTSVQWTPGGDKLVTAGHDQRIRVWDAATGRNDLVHFGPRVRNARQAETTPLVSPAGTHAPGGESLFWPNDDGRGDVFRHHLREGHLLRILRTQGVKVAEIQAKRPRGAAYRSGSVRLTSGGRINAMAWRVHAAAGEGVEMYTAHGDGRIGAWKPAPNDDDDDDDGDHDDDRDGPSVEVPVGPAGEESPADDAERRRKRKRDLIGGLVEGLARQPRPLS